MNFVPRSYCHSDIGRRQKWYSVRKKTCPGNEVVQTSFSENWNSLPIFKDFADFSKHFSLGTNQSG